ncbi:D-glycero-alpha-D-manno-heptose 1-phosphate guanylyltransferase [Sporotomaculum syntrophicum]|uniref:D-glycero-alpha-D-manno-heptose 1-phosphate guanylyltransferase n=1 Tax=Sporotomaculum syntrophicum TaxID=182264 RepID=A0A9D2WRU3_9FIRM|nr:sugar phosphate nucleotidyltransferase [Sporotomaculum syntrophicum]KAF1086415.1 D-glycero-alpha-D-manno-heptose 1-phosphate guanylyltransferase [Sporotomaculum syntrophicum]
MKAIIMAGGEGSRLRPLTCGIPKPMVPVMNRPIMTSIIDLLRKHNFTDIGVTLQYMPEAISSYYGNGSDYNINLKYFIEEQPLGTAGSVKNAQQFLDETFLVISGDALTDFDLTEAMAFHRSKGAMATLVLTKVPCPLEYGVVITGSDGHIKQFLEKPSWGEVFSDTVNTGIYILEPEVLDYVPEGQSFDFSKDLYPRLLSEDKPMFGVVLDGYWCDIGDLKQYLQSHNDFLAGSVKLALPDQEIMPGVWAGRDVRIDDSAIINGPVLLGDGVTVSRGVKIDQYTVIGPGCMIQDGASIKRSVLWDNVFVAPGVNLRGAVLGSRVQVQAGSSVYEGAVIGSNTVIKERCMVNPDVKLWPHKIVETGSVVRESMVWGSGAPRHIFGLEGISGIANIEMTPEFASRVAAAFADTLGARPRVCLSSDIYSPSRLIRDALNCGLRSAGAQVYQLPDGITPMHRFGVSRLQCDGGMHVRISPRQPEAVNIIITNSQGGNIARSAERKIENLLAREDFKRAGFQQITELQQAPEMSESYLQHLMRDIDINAIRAMGLSLAAVYDPDCSGRFLESLCRELNIKLERLNLDGPVRMPLNWSVYRDYTAKVSAAVTDGGLSMGLIMDSGADHLTLIDNRGRTVQDNLLVTLTALLVLRSRGDAVVVPVTAPRAVELLAEKFGARVIRTKTAVQDFYEKLVDQDNLAGREKSSTLSQALLHFDALATVLKIAEYLAVQKIDLAALVDEIPEFFMENKATAVPWATKGTVIRSLIEEMPQENLELLDGVKVFHPDGWALVLPDPEEPVCRVFSEGSTMEIAESLADFYIDKINKIVGPVQ